MPKPNTLSRTAQAVLEAAAVHDTHFATTPEHLPTAAQCAVVQSLLKAGLLEEVAAEVDGPAWRTAESGERLVLRLTKAGLTAAGVATAPDGLADAGQAQEAEAEPPTGIGEAPRSLEESLARTAASADPVSRRSLRAAAQAVLSAWDDPTEGRPGLADALDALRAVLAPGAAARTSKPAGVPRRPRPDTKRAAVLALLRRPEGATVAQVIDATGWAPHTVRGFFAGLNKAGTPVDVLERVRQVGPGREGAKGSYTVYHMAEAR